MTCQTLQLIYCKIVKQIMGLKYGIQSYSVIPTFLNKPFSKSLRTLASGILVEESTMILNNIMTPGIKWNKSLAKSM